MKDLRICQFTSIIKNNLNVSFESAGRFHGFGKCLQETLSCGQECGTVQVSMGMVELENGDMVQVPIESLQFRDV